MLIQWLKSNSFQELKDGDFLKKVNSWVSISVAVSSKMISVYENNRRFVSGGGLKVFEEEPKAIEYIQKLEKEA